jgi:ABC-2 type transport system ATP-binding protein
MYSELTMEIKEATQLVWQGKNLNKSFGSGQFELKNINLSILEGEITGIVGENGNGKTTLLRIIAGDLGVNSGEISAWGKPILPFQWRAFKEQVSYIPQRIPRWFGFLRTNLLFQASTHGIPPHEIESTIDFLLEELGLTKYSHLKWTEISTGYRLRFELARTLIGNPKLIILDEPIANLDINAQEKFLTDLKKIVSHPKHKTAVILSSQHLHQVEAYSDNIIFIKQGKIEYSGKLEAIGKDRKVNTFEISGDFTSAQLLSLFSAQLISEKGKVLLFETDLTVSSQEVLVKLIEKGFSIDYFRNISSSTKKLFI